MLRPRHASPLFLAAALLILEAVTSVECHKVFSCDDEPSNLTFSNISTSASCRPGADSCLGALKYQNSSNLQDGGSRLQNSFTNASTQGMMDILKSRRLANRKFRLSSDGVYSALPSDEIFTTAHKLARRRRPQLVVLDHVAANASWVNQTGVDTGAWNITAVNLTAVDTGAWNVSAANLTTAGLAACDLSMAHLTHGGRTSAHNLV